MGDFVTDLLDNPVFRTLLLWTVGFTVVALLLAIPAYFVFAPVLRALREQLEKFVVRFTASIETTRVGREKRVIDQTDEYLQDAGLRRILHGGDGGWTGALTPLARALRRLRRPVAKAARALTSIKSDVSKVIERLHRIHAQDLQSLPDFPDKGQVIESAGAYRRAWFTLVLSVSLLAAMIVVNMGLTSNILKGIGFISPSIVYFGVPLATIVAFLLAAADAGLGVCHAATRNDSWLWPVFFVILAFIISGFDGWAFSRIDQSDQTFLLPLIGYEMRQADLMFLFGFAITWTLFGLGALAFESGIRVLTGKESELFISALRRLRKHHQAYTDAVLRAKEQVLLATSEISRAESTLAGSAVGGESVVEALESVRQALDAASSRPLPIAEPEERALTRTEVRQLANQAGVWFVGAGTGIAVMILVTRGSLSRSTLGVEWALAIGQALVCLGVGSLLSAGESLIVRGGARTNERPIVSAPVLSRLAAYVIGGTLMAIYVMLSLMVGASWLVNLVVGLFLIAAGYQLTPMLAVISLWFSNCYNMLVFATAAIVLALVKLVQVVAVVLETIASVLAKPLDLLFGGRRGPPPSAIDRLSIT